MSNKMKQLKQFYVFMYLNIQDKLIKNYVTH